MPPPRRALPEDTLSRADETLPSKLKSTSYAPGRGKRNGNAAHTNNLREIASSNSASAVNSAILAEQKLEGGNLFDWQSASPELLHDYRHLHRMSLPSCFKNPVASLVLGPHTGFGRTMGIGRYSPTMARPRWKRRVAREELSKMVRKHFNSLAVSEGDVVVDMMYKVKYQDKAFSAKFGQPRRSAVDAGGGGASETAKVASQRSDFVQGQQQR